MFQMVKDTNGPTVWSDASQNKYTLGNMWSPGANDATTASSDLTTGVSFEMPQPHV